MERKNFMGYYLMNYLRNYLRNYLIIFLYIFIRKMARNSNVHIDTNMLYIVVIALAIIVVIYMVTNKSHAAHAPIVVSAPQGNCQNMLDMCQSKLTKCNTKFGDSVEKFANFGPPATSQSLTKTQESVASKIKTALGGSNSFTGYRLLNSTATSPLEGTLASNVIYGSNGIAPLKIMMETSNALSCTSIANSGLFQIGQYNGPGFSYISNLGKVQCVFQVLLSKNFTCPSSDSSIINIFNLVNGTQKIKLPVGQLKAASNDLNSTILHLYDSLITYTNIIPFYLLNSSNQIIPIGDCYSDGTRTANPDTTTTYGNVSATTTSNGIVYEDFLTSIVLRYVDGSYIDETKYKYYSNIN